MSFTEVQCHRHFKDDLIFWSGSKIMTLELASVALEQAKKLEI